MTGASAGIGAATARELARRGFHVLAGVRRGEDADALRAMNLEPIMLDITNEAEIAALVKRITDDPERRPLRALVNNAGVSVNAPVEVLPLSEWRRLFDVNLFGHVAMMQALLPALIESRGTVVNISSVGGKVAMATYGPYAGSKFALEAVSDALRREVGPLGVKVIVVEPGAVTTDMLGRVAAAGERVISGMTAGQRGRYARLMQSIIAQAQAGCPQGSACRGGRPCHCGRDHQQAASCPLHRWPRRGDHRPSRQVPLGPGARQPARPQPQAASPQGSTDDVNAQRPTSLASMVPEARSAMTRSSGTPDRYGDHEEAWGVHAAAA